MRIKPAVTIDEAYGYLAQSAVFSWGVAAAAQMDPHLHSIAEAMATVSALDIPDETEPLFGENIDVNLLKEV